MITARRARRLALDAVSPLPGTHVPLREAVNRVTVGDVAAPFDLPRFTNSAMDGYALHSRTTRRGGGRVRLGLQPGIIVAGARRTARLHAGRAVRIMTGAPMPRGSNAVLAQEDARVEGGSLLVSAAVRAGANVRRAGEDCREGQVILPSGTLLHPGLIALLSAFGLSSVKVHRPPRIAVVVTGDEVRPAARARLPRAGVYDTHTAFLTSALREIDLSPSMVARTRDRAVEIETRIRAALQRVDLVLVTGGVSVGERDVVRPVLKSLGVRTLFWRVAQKPGKPLYFGRLRRSFVFGLPGNPASTVACYVEYVRPVLRRMLGMARCHPEEVIATLSKPIVLREGRTYFLRGRLRQEPRGWSVTVARSDGSHQLTPFRRSDCLVVIPQGRGNRPRSSRRVVVHPFPWSTK